LIQTGSFQNPAEADDMKAKLAFIGLMASVEPASVADKGTWYRVRVGDFASAKDAVAAKASFEKRHSVIALVAPR